MDIYPKAAGLIPVFFTNRCMTMPSSCPCNRTLNYMNFAKHIFISLVVETRSVMLSKNFDVLYFLYNDIVQNKLFLNGDQPTSPIRQTSRP